MTDALSYEPFAEQYDRGSETSPFNSRLERPAIQALCPPLHGRRVLEVGCAGGRLTRWLVDRGARVTAFDVSPTLVEIARTRVEGAVEFHTHDLRDPIDFVEEGSVDVVVVSLTMHYVHDWAPPLAEFRRLLAPGGIVIISTHHPLADIRLSPSGDYFAVEAIDDEWAAFGPPPMVVRFFRRPLEAIFEDARNSGLSLVGLVEPRATEKDRDVFGEKFDKVSAKPWFIVFVFAPSAG